MTDNTKLLPCPFCGGKAYFERLGSTRFSNIVACKDCGARLENGATFNHEAAWNTRAPDVSGSWM